MTTHNRCLDWPIYNIINDFCIALLHDKGKAKYKNAKSVTFFDFRTFGSTWLSLHHHLSSFNVFNADLRYGHSLASFHDFCYYSKATYFYKVILSINFCSTDISIISNITCLTMCNVICLFDKSFVTLIRKLTIYGNEYDCSS